jgi:hypothetical protein
LASEVYVLDASKDALPQPVVAQHVVAQQVVAGRGTNLTAVLTDEQLAEWAINKLTLEVFEELSYLRWVYQSHNLSRKRVTKPYEGTVPKGYPK